MICFHFMLFEQELIIALFILFAFTSRLPYYLIILLFIILLFDTLIACRYRFNHSFLISTLINSILLNVMDYII